MELDATFIGGQNEGIYQTAQRLVRGNIGENLATWALAAMGHEILYFKPSILGTNQGGIDMVTMFNGCLYLIDNKALSRSGNISSVSALTYNLNQNLATMRAAFQVALNTPNISANQTALWTAAIKAIDAHNFVRAVTNANIVRGSTNITSGVTTGLQNQGIVFINLF